MSGPPSKSRVHSTSRRLALLGAAWLASFALPRRDVVVQVSAASTITTPGESDGVRPEASPPVRSWRAAAVRTLGSDHYSFRAAVRRLPSDATGPCADRELLVANGYDHAPQYLARIAFRPAGAACIPETHPYAWSPRALHFSDVAVADLDRDGQDEIVVSAFAEVGGRMHTGSVHVVAGDDPWRVDPPALPLDGDDGLSPSSLAIGDLDGDGRLDLVVGTFWRGARGAGRDIKHVRGSELDGPTLWFRGVDPRARAFAAPLALAPRGVIDLQLADVDLDGAVDLVAAGASVMVVFGPDFAEVRELPLESDDDNAVAPSVDVSWSADRSQALIAFSTSCLSADECARASGRFGLTLWAITTAHREARRLGLWPTRGVPAPVRFVSSPRGPVPDLIVGIMNEPIGQRTEAIVGRPLLGALGLVGGSPLILPGAAFEVGDAASDDDDWEVLALRTPSPAAPMASAIVPYGDPREAREVVDHPARAGSIFTYTGPGELVGAEVRTPDGRDVPVHHVPGDAHVSLALSVEPALESGDLVVTWRIVERPNLIITSACPLAGPAAGTLFVKPPDRARGSHADRSPRE